MNKNSDFSNKLEASSRFLGKDQKLSFKKGKVVGLNEDFSALNYPEVIEIIFAAFS